MYLEFDCTECGQRLRIEEGAVGAPVRCPQCEHIQSAPDPTKPPPAIPVAELAEEPEPSGSERSHGEHLASQVSDFAANPYREAPVTSNPYAAPLTMSRHYAQQVLSEYRLARPTARFAAAVVDWLFFVACLLPGFVATNVLDRFNLVWADRVGAILMVTIVLSGVGYQCWLTATQGRTIGKTLLGIRIISAEGNPPGFLAGVVLRQWIFAILTPCRAFSALFYVIDSLFVFSQTRQCIHDMVASTFVVDDMEPSQIRHND